MLSFAPLVQKNMRHLAALGPPTATSLWSDKTGPISIIDTFNISGIIRLMRISDITFSAWVSFLRHKFQKMSLIRWLRSRDDRESLREWESLGEKEKRDVRGRGNGRWKGRGRGRAWRRIIACYITYFILLHIISVIVIFIDPSNSFTYMYYINLKNLCQLCNLPKYLDCIS